MRVEGRRLPELQRLFALAGAPATALRCLLRSSLRRSLEVELPSRVSERITLPADPVLFFGYGMTPQAAAAMEGPVSLEVTLAGDGQQLSLFGGEWKPKVNRLRSVGEEVLVDLADFAGRTVEISFEARGLTARPLQPERDDAGARGFFWASPLIASRQLVREQPSIILIGIGSLRADHLGCYGYDRETSPTIDALAARGVRFGYAEHFDLYRKISGFRALSTVTDWLDGIPDMPLFLWLHTYDVHARYGSVPTAYHDLFTAPDHHDPFDLQRNKPTDVQWAEANQGRPSAADMAYMTDLYDGEIRFVDDGLGELFAWLERSGRKDNTYVILVSDHGQEFGDHGRLEHRNGHLYEELLRVPMIIAGPGIPSGRTVSTLVETIDLLPTVLQLLGRPGGSAEGPGLDGHDLSR